MNIRVWAKFAIATTILLWTWLYFALYELAKLNDRFAPEFRPKVWIAVSILALVSATSSIALLRKPRKNKPIDIE